MGVALKKWTASSEVIAAAAVAKSASVTSDSIELDPQGYFDAVIQIKVIFGASANGDATIGLLKSLDGTTFDTEQTETDTITVSAGNTVYKSIKISGVPYCKVVVGNGNVANEDITVSANVSRARWTE